MDEKQELYGCGFFHRITDLDNIQPFWVPVDDWDPGNRWQIMKQSKNCIYLPVSEFAGKEDKYDYLNAFVLQPKRCYNADNVRSHICQYVNYFEALYDTEHELLYHYCRIKLAMEFGVVIDPENNIRRPYTKEDLYADIQKYILSDSIYDKVWRMVKDNYTLNLKYKNRSNEALQYNNYHGEYLMEISVFQNILIPLVVHFAYKSRMVNEININNMLFDVYNMLFKVYLSYEFMQKRAAITTDVYSKLYETVNTMMNSNYAGNKTLWMISEIRGYNPTISTFDSVNLLIMQMMPKYRFNENMISYNIAGIRKSITYNVTGIAYEYDFSPMSSSKRDGEDNASQTDKYEAHLIKTDESLVLHNNYRKNKVMENIINRYGPFDDDEIAFYKKRLTSGYKSTANTFQFNLVKDLFYKEFGDTHSIASINVKDYIILMIAAKRVLTYYNMKLLPYILSGNFTKISSRMTLCKKETVKITSSQYYNSICEKYRFNKKIEEKIISTISTIISSSIEAIDYYNPRIDGSKIVIDTDILIDEVLMFISMI